MGKRGPAPQGEYAGKSQVLSTRIRPDTRAALQEASKKSRRSLSQEIEHRLRRTFIEDEKIELAFGNRQNFSIMRTIAMALQLNSRPLKEPDELPYWLTDAKTFDLTALTISKVLAALRPLDAESSGTSAPEQDAVDDFLSAFRSPNRNEALVAKKLREIMAEVAAMETWEMIGEADPGQPLSSGTIDHHRRALLKTDLGSLLARPNSLQEVDSFRNKRRFVLAIGMAMLDGLREDGMERGDEG